MVSAKQTQESITYVNFLGFKFYCFTPPHILQSYFLPMEISIGPDEFFSFFHFLGTLCMRINLINLADFSWLNLKACARYFSF